MTGSARRTAAAFCGLAALLAVLLTPLPSAWAEPVSGTQDAYIPISWDGPTTNLTWDGKTYTTADGTVVATPLSVPGDRAERTATVRNAGPSAATFTVQLYDVTATNYDGTTNTELQDLIHLFWDFNGGTGDETWTQLIADTDADGASYTTLFPVEKGATFKIMAGYYFPEEATGGRRSGKPSQMLSFKIRIMAQGNDVATEITPSPKPSGGPGKASASPSLPISAHTGGSVVAPDLVLVAAGGLALVGAGALMGVARRKAGRS